VDIKKGRETRSLRIC